jgi:hypothetical protein
MEIKAENYLRAAKEMGGDLVYTMIENGITDENDILEYYNSVVIPILGCGIVETPFDFPTSDSYLWMRNCKNEYKSMYDEFKNRAAIEGLILSSDPDKFFFFWIQYVLKFLNKVDYRPFWNIIPNDYDLKIYSSYKERLLNGNHRTTALADTWQSVDKRNPETQGNSYNYGYFNGKIPSQIGDVNTTIDTPTDESIHQIFNEDVKDWQKYFDVLTICEPKLLKKVEAGYDFIGKQKNQRGLIGMWFKSLKLIGVIKADIDRDLLAKYLSNYIKDYKIGGSTIDSESNAYKKIESQLKNLLSNN